MRTLFIILLTLLMMESVALSANKTYVRPAFILASGNLKFVFPQMLQKFYAKYPDASVHISYRSSGDLMKEILAGEKYDIFFSANKNYAQKVYLENKSATKPKVYAQGILILFVPPNLPLKKEGLNVLSSDKIKNITVANKATAPYGVAAIEALTNSKCCTHTLQKIRYSSDVATAIDNVIWEGDAGFLSKSALYMLPDNRKKEGVDWIEVDPKLYTPIIQAYVVSQNGLKNPNARKFLNFIHSDEGQKIFRDNGYKNIKPNK